MRTSGDYAAPHIYFDSTPSETVCRSVLEPVLRKIIYDKDHEALECWLRDHPTFDLCKTLTRESPPLRMAVIRSNEAVTAILLNRARDYPDMLMPIEPTGDSVLFTACIAKKTSIIKMIIEAGAELNEVNRDTGLTPLLVSANGGHVDAIRVLCDAGADRDIADGQGRTALMYLIEAGNVEGIDALLEKGGATVDGLRYLDSSTCLAVTKNNVPVLQALIKHGADVNRRGLIWGITPLMQATWLMDSSAMVNALLGAGADITVKDYRGYTALMCAAEANNVELIQTLSTHPGVEVDGRSYHQLVGFDTPNSENYKKAVAVLTERSPSRGIFLYSETALMIAAQNGNLEAAEALLDMGAGLNAVNDKGHTVLMLAAESGAHELVTVLCARGAKPNLKANDGLTALANGVKSGVARVVEALIAVGVDVNQSVDNQNGTALMLAASEGRETVLSVLHSAGANLDALDSAGDTALAKAVRGGHFAVVRKLLALGANPNAGDATRTIPLSIAAGVGDERVVSTLLKKNANINASDARGFSALMAAAQGGHIDVVKILIDAGVNIFATTNAGRDAMHYAMDAVEIDNDAQEIVDLLIAHGRTGIRSKRRIGKG